jgi:predicted phage gp36 major capsid-like protein
MAEKSREATVKALVKELSKTKGGVTVSEEDGETIVRTRDGDEHRFKPLEGEA